MLKQFMKMSTLTKEGVEKLVIIGSGPAAHTAASNLSIISAN